MNIYAVEWCNPITDKNCPLIPTYVRFFTDVDTFNYYLRYRQQIGFDRRNKPLPPELL